MPDYKTMYFTLFNAITDAMKSICDAGSVTEAVHILSDAQIKTEEIYIDTYEDFPEQEEMENGDEE